MSKARLTAYLDRRERAQGLDREHIHSFDGDGDDPGFQLLQSDLRSLLADLERAEKALKGIDKLDPHKDSATEWNAALHEVSAALSQIAGGGDHP